MKIDGVGRHGGPRAAGGSAPPQGACRGGRSGAPAGDRVDMSPQAREVARLSESAARLPEVRDEIVGRLRAAVGQGTYQVDPSAVARAIVEFEDGTGR